MPKPNSSILASTSDRTLNIITARIAAINARKTAKFGSASARVAGGGS